MLINGSKLFDILRYLYSLYAFSQKSGTAKLPFRYILELTYKCNLNCPFCYIKDKTNKDELSTKEWFDIINQIPPLSLISFVAGEVLLKEDFIKIYEKASEKFRKITVITNGIKLNNDIVNSFIKNRLFLLSVSLDGFETNHDKIRNFNGLWDKVTTNIELFNSKRGKKSAPMLDIKTCILENNLDDLPLLYKEAMKMNAQFFSLTFIRNHQMRQNSHLAEEFSPEFYEKEYPIEPYFDINHFEEVYKELQSLSENSKTILRYAPRFNAQNDFDRIKRFWTAGNKPVQELYNDCRIPFTSIYITPKGDIYPCLSYKIANLKEVSLKEAINTIKFKCFRKNLYAAKIFNACQMCCDAIPKNF